MYLIYTACKRLRLSTDIKSLLTYLLICNWTFALTCVEARIHVFCTCSEWYLLLRTIASISALFLDCSANAFRSFKVSFQICELLCFGCSWKMRLYWEYEESTAGRLPLIGQMFQCLACLWPFTPLSACMRRRVAVFRGSCWRWIGPLYMIASAATPLHMLSSLVSDGIDRYLSVQHFSWHGWHLHGRLGWMWSRLCWKRGISQFHVDWLDRWDSVILSDTALVLDGLLTETSVRRKYHGREKWAKYENK